MLLLTCYGARGGGRGTCIAVVGLLRGAGAGEGRVLLLLGHDVVAAMVMFKSPACWFEVSRMNVLSNEARIAELSLLMSSRGGLVVVVSRVGAEASRHASKGCRTGRSSSGVAGRVGALAKEDAAHLVHGCDEGGSGAAATILGRRRPTAAVVLGR